MKSRFDYSDGDYCFDMGGGMMMDTEGNLMQDMGGGMAMDLDSGELHIMSFEYRKPMSRPSRAPIRAS